MEAAHASSAAGWCQWGTLGLGGFRLPLPGSPEQVAEQARGEDEDADVLSRIQIQGAPEARLDGRIPPETLFQKPGDPIAEDGKGENLPVPTATLMPDG